MSFYDGGHERGRRSGQHAQPQYRHTASTLMLLPVPDSLSGHVKKKFACAKVFERIVHFPGAFED